MVLNIKKSKQKEKSDNIKKNTLLTKVILVIEI